MPRLAALTADLRSSRIFQIVGRVALLACAFATGCHSTVQDSTGPVAGVAIKGSLHGGQQPVTGASVQLYAAGTQGDELAATALLTPAVATDSFGGFNITAKYTCPSASTEVYLIASGDNPGSSSSINNLALSEMAALGQCGTLSASSFNPFQQDFERTDVLF